MSGLDGCKRCPTCHLVPVVSMEDKVLGQPGTDVILRCQTHAHTAQGDTLEMAIKHWNHYIAYVVQTAGRHLLEKGPGRPDETFCTFCWEYTKSKEYPDRVECAGFGVFQCYAVKVWKVAA